MRASEGLDNVEVRSGRPREPTARRRIRCDRRQRFSSSCTTYTATPSRVLRGSPTRPQTQLDASWWSIMTRPTTDEELRRASLGHVWLGFAARRLSSAELDRGRLREQCAGSRSPGNCQGPHAGCAKAPTSSLAVSDVEFRLSTTRCRSPDSARQTTGTSTEHELGESTIDTTRGAHTMTVADTDEPKAGHRVQGHWPSTRCPA